ncbi:MAG: hypothetical protein ACP5IZ_08730 [Thermoprotei archaeon]
MLVVVHIDKLRKTLHDERSKQNTWSQLRRIQRRSLRVSRSSSSSMLSYPIEILSWMKNLAENLIVKSG